MYMYKLKGYVCYRDMHGFLAKMLMARSEPLIQAADPHITKLVIGPRMKDKDGQNKKTNKWLYFIINAQTFKSLQIHLFFILLMQEQIGFQWDSKLHFI